jgi:5-formyltetrahydrofolate cyclo-ligase
MLSKKDLRNQYIAARNKLTPAERQSQDKKIGEALTRLIETKGFQTVLAFRAFGSEPAVHNFLAAIPGVEIAIPVVDVSTKSMEFYSVSADQAYQKNNYGIEEPAPPLGAPVLPNERTLIILPCVAASHEGHRLGYGGGFYDRYLARFPSAVRAGVVYRQFYVPKLPVDAHDQKLHHVVVAPSS